MEPVKTACNHTFCRECLVQWLGSSSTCPSCRNRLFERSQLEQDWDAINLELADLALDNTDAVSDVASEIELPDLKRKRGAEDEDEDEEVPDDQDPDFVQYMLRMTNHILHTTDQTSPSPRTWPAPQSFTEIVTEKRALSLTRAQILSAPVNARDCLLAWRTRLGAPVVAGPRFADPQTELRLQVLALTREEILTQNSGLQRQLIYLRWQYNSPIFGEAGTCCGFQYPKGLTLELACAMARQREVREEDAPWYKSYPGTVRRPWAVESARKRLMELGC